MLLNVNMAHLLKMWNTSVMMLNVNISHLVKFSYTSNMLLHTNMHNLIKRWDTSRHVTFGIKVSSFNILLHVLFDKKVEHTQYVVTCQHFQFHKKKSDTFSMLLHVNVSHLIKRWDKSNLMKKWDTFKILLHVNMSHLIKRLDTFNMLLHIKCPIW